MIPVAIAAIVAELAKQGLSLLGSAVLSKGQEAVEKKLGVKLPDLLGSEEGRVRLRQLELQHEQFLVTADQRDAERNLEYFRLELGDLDSARRMQAAALAQADLFSKRFVYWLALATLAFGGLYVVAITFLPLPADNVRFADTTLGFILGSLMAPVIAYFFGSSRGSKDKDETLQALAKGRP